MKLKEHFQKRYYDIAKLIADKLVSKPEIGAVAGSGFADVFLGMQIIQEISFEEIQGLPSLGVAGHVPKIVLVQHANKIVLVFTGRFHRYEGRTAEEICLPTAIFHYLGIHKVVYTNAAGGLNDDFEIGDLMLANGLINRLSVSSLSLFEDTPHSTVIPYDRNSFSIVNKFLEMKAISVRNGIYLATTGPNYETRSEIRYFRIVGADAVGMSTVVEAEFAVLLGMQTVALSLITNKLKEMKTDKVSHEEVLDISKNSTERIARVLYGIIEAF